MLVENIDYYINEDGNFVFLEKYHLERGYCCKNGCRHCPWKFKKVNDVKTKDRGNNLEQ